MLKRWAAVEGVHMIEEVCSLISARTGSNLRETHGACGRLSAYASVKAADFARPGATGCCTSCNDDD